jgi:hypothetical protein
MAAREMSEGRRSEPEGYRAEELGERVTGLHDETKWSVLTTEFWAMVNQGGWHYPRIESAARGNRSEHLRQLERSTPCP